ncbi:MAG TPA: DegT/DnrJ/EryC1/StrS family aminotransferase [Longimicrobiales bacterium]|nr:DegT/DnrJ/EryC1/StrS family aminotransferase [Longimicrobiales bacterium]
MDVPLLDLVPQYLSLKAQLDTAVMRVVESQRFVLGAEVEALEAELASYLGVKHAIGCASGTDALLLPLKALDAEPGSDVIVPSFTFFATAGAVWNAGLRPVFCDVDPETFNVTAATLDAAWTDRTAAVVPVHLFGQMAPMAEINAWAEKKGVFVLEDAAQAIGARSAQGRAGAVGDAGALSFFPTKNLGGFGDGGVVTTDDDALADKVAKLRVHGGRQMYHHEMVGTNSRLDALQAAVLRVKLPHLDTWAAERAENARRYHGLLAGLEGLALPLVAPGNIHVFNQYTLRVDRRDEVREHLAAQGIGSGVYYPVPLHLQACFAGLGGAVGDLPVTETLCKQVLSLPIFPELGEERLTRVALAIRAFFGSQGSV